MKIYITILTLFLSIVLANTEKQSTVYDKAYVEETFKLKYSDDWKFRWNMHGTPHRVYGTNISYVFDYTNEELAEYYARQFVKENQWV